MTIGIEPDRLATPTGDPVAALETGGAGEAFAAVDPVSVDYAVVEPPDDDVVVPAGFEWGVIGWASAV